MVSGLWYLMDPNADGGRGGMMWLGDAIVFVEDHIYRVGSLRFRVEFGGNKVLRSFLAAPAMSAEEMVARSGMKDAVRILRRLREPHGGVMHPFIHLPGHKSKPIYHVAIRRA
jgi:hypothetical protein